MPDATPPPLDRRRFFGSAAGAALTLSAAGYANVVGSNDRVRVGFLGCGGRAQAHIDLVNRLAKDGKPVTPAAVCDVWDGLEDEYEVEFGGKVTRRRYAQGLFPSAKKCGFTPSDKARVTKDYRRVLELKDVDAVCVTTPDHWHARMTLDALHAGKDVYVEKPMTRTADEAVAVLDACKQTGRVVTVGVQSMADPVWVRAFEFVRAGGIGHVAQGQTGFFRNDVRGQWRYYRLAAEMTPRTIDWDLFLGHRFEVGGRPVGPTAKEVPFDRAAFAQWRCYWPFGGGPFTDMMVHNVTHLTAAMGVQYPARVAAGGGLNLELDGRDVPDIATVVADYEEGCQLLVTATTISGYPLEEVIRGRLGAIKFVRGGFQVFRDDPSRGASFPVRLERPPEPSEFVAVEPPRNDTEALWENFLECVRARRACTFSPPDLGAAAVATAAMAVESFRTGRAQTWDRERRAVAPADGGWADRGRGRAAGDAGRALNPPAYQRFAGPWRSGKDPAV